MTIYYKYEWVLEINFVFGFPVCNNKAHLLLSQFVVIRFEFKEKKINKQN